MIIIFTLLTTIIFLPIYKRLLIRFNSVDYNYKQNIITVSYGGFIFVIETVILFALGENVLSSYIWYAFLLITVVGTYDDFFGDKKVKGLKGHLKAFFREGIITSGFLKAATGGIIALFLGYKTGDNLFSFISHFLVILLMINMINLFDLRPGRALKVFFLFYVALSTTTFFLSLNKTAFILISILIIVFFEDVRAKIMLGDSGANLIGLHLGIWYSIYLPLFYQWILIGALIFLHYYTERFSLTKLIEKNRILKEIDSWGRKGTI